MAEEITEEEAALYDRQIRLWGFDSQKRIRESRVLLVGLGGLGAEVAKNVILAGVKSITLLDKQNVTREDLCCNFLVTEDDLNKNRAQSSLNQAQQLNPMVNVLTDTEDLSSKDTDFFNKFDVVILTKCTKEEMVRVDDICRHNSTKFFSGDVFGYFGFFFIDLSEHKYAEEKEISIPVDPTSEPPKIIKETRVEKKETDYVAIREILDKDWSSEKNGQLLKKLSGSYFIMQCLLKFRSVHGRSPLKERSNQDTSELLKIRDELLESMGVDKARIDNNFASAVFAELSPVCAVVGGLLSQEVIKAISCKDQPFNNFFSYYALDDSAIVEQIK